MAMEIWRGPGVECAAHCRARDRAGPFSLSCQCVSTVDPEIPSPDANCVCGHREDPGGAGVFSPVDLLTLVSDGNIYKILKLPGVGHSSVTH